MRAPRFNRGEQQLLLLLGIFTVALAAVGLVVQGLLKESIRERARGELEAIARLKVESVHRWRQERIGDARWVAESSNFAREARAFFDHPEDPRSRADVELWIEGWIQAQNYHRVLLLDATSEVRFANPATAEALEAVTAETARKVSASRQLTMTPLYLDPASGQATMDLMIPLLQRGDAAEYVGAVVFQIDLQRFLFPHIQTWPTPSPSAETLLVRRDGENVIYLNELRHRRGTALRLKMSLAQTQLPSVRAILGERGVFVGVDYRGVPVLSALAAIPDSPWFIVAQQELKEVDAPVRQWAWMLGGVMFIMMVAATLAVGYVWRTRETHFTREEMAERRQAEEAIRISERELRSLYAAMTEMLVVHETVTDGTGRVVDYRIVECNPAFERATGFSRQRAIGSLATVLYGNDPPPYLDTYARVAATGEATQLEVFYAPLEKHFDISVFSPRPGRFATVTSDVTEQKKAVEALVRSEAMLRETGRIARLGGWEIEIASSRLTWTREVYEIHEVEDGFEPTVGRGVDFYTPSSREIIREAVERAIRDGQPYDLELEMQTARGRLIWVRVQGSASWEDGKAVRIAGTFQDITSRKVTEIALRDSRQRLSLHFEQTPMAVIEWDLEGRVARWNPAAERIFGYGAVEAQGRTVTELIVPASDREDFEIARKALIAGGIGRRRTQENRSKDGHIVLCEWYDTPLVGADGRAAVVASLILDVTDRRRHELERGLLLAELKRKNDELESMIYVASHDLRGPLINVQGFGKRLARECQALLAAGGKSEPESGAGGRITKALGYIRSSADKMDSLIAGMLRVSRLGRVEPNVQSVDIAGLIRDVVTTMMFQVQDAGAEVIVEVMPVCPGDPVLLSQVFANLIDNALKYRDRDRSLVIRCSGRQEGAMLLYCLADNGRGIRPEHQERIWEMFHRLEPNGRVPGDGLGLNIARRILDCHRGRIWVESVLGEGSRFYLELPRLDPV